MSADLDALDRGVIEAGVTAAEALSRVAVLEARVEALSRAIELVGVATGQPAAAAAARTARRPHLQVVREP
jgi:hypothetical protein